MPGIATQSSHFSHGPYQAAMHAQRRSLVSTLRYSALMLSGLVVAPLLLPAFATWGHFSRLHAAALAGAVIVLMFVARAVYHRYGATSLAYRRVWQLETAVTSFGLLSLAWVGGDHGFPFWLLYWLQVLLVALEDTSTHWPKVLFAIGPIVVAIGDAVLGQNELLAWALVFACCAEVMCFELQRVGRKLAEEATERQLLAGRVLELSRLDERKRIAQDLHDGLAAELTALSYRISEASRASPDEPTSSAFGDIGDRVQAAVDELRSVVWAMRAPAQAFDEVAEYLRLRCTELCLGKVTLEFRALDHAEPNEPLTGSVRVAVGRLVLEGVRNAVRHGSPGQVSVLIERAEGLSVVIEDDGRGLPGPETRTLGAGLSNMRARAHALGGSFAILSSASGTKLTSMLPLTAD